jgi:hypothetical protein
VTVGVEQLRLLEIGAPDFLDARVHPHTEHVVIRGQEAAPSREERL